MSTPCAINKLHLHNLKKKNKRYYLFNRYGFVCCAYLIIIFGSWLNLCASLSSENTLQTSNPKYQPKRSWQKKCTVTREFIVQIAIHWFRFINKIVTLEIGDAYLIWFHFYFFTKSTVVFSFHVFFFTASLHTFFSLSMYLEFFQCYKTFFNSCSVVVFFL